MARFYVWDNYWNRDRIYSFGVEQDSEEAVAFQRHWFAFARRLPAGASVLDVACGNGAAALNIARGAQASGAALAITGIDEAAIDPPRHLPEHAETLKTIAFRPRTTMEALPFEDGVFEAAVSQYGIEFGDPMRALAEMARVLKPNGLLSILALPASGTVAKSAGKSVKQARYLLHDTPLFDEAIRITQEFHDAPHETRDQIMRGNLESFNVKVEKAIAQFAAGEVDVVSAIIARLNDVFIERKHDPLEKQLIDIQSVRTRLAHFAARAQASVKAAVGDGKLGTLRSALAKLGFVVEDARSLFVQGQGVIAIQLTCQRPAMAKPPA